VVGLAERPEGAPAPEPLGLRGIRLRVALRVEAGQAGVGLGHGTPASSRPVSSGSTATTAVR
jgi:hypothetical protein